MGCVPIFTFYALHPLLEVFLEISVAVFVAVVAVEPEVSELVFVAVVVV
jgi:hypothetical protein